MTPLAHQLARQLTLPEMKRRLAWQGQDEWLREKLSALHCFEVSAVTELANEIGAFASTTSGVMDGLVFCPAPKTWIEGFWSSWGRIGLLVEDHTTCAIVTAFWENGFRVLGGFSTQVGGMIQPVGNRPKDAPERWLAQVDKYFDPDALDRILLNAVQMFLYVINSPKVIGRREHKPHPNLKRELEAVAPALCQAGFRPWIEVRLEAKPTYVDGDGIERTVVLAGRKCLHFCRTHVRIRNGKLEIVGSHWRGDAALGIQRARYKVLPPRQAAVAA